MEDKYIGRMLDGRYEILERIGSGGMAVVYKAMCHRLNRLVAVKILKEDLAQDEEFKRRFYTEAQAVAMLSHPNIVSVYDVSHSDNIQYIVMELIEGITLKQYINRKGMLTWKETLHFSIQITKALIHAHSRGIIHRDIKPHNIMILRDGSVKVADFGIARLLNTQNTLTQEALGSVHYISPEQARGSHVDARSDIYSVGVVMYEMLTSRLPFEGESAVAIAIQHISSTPLLPTDLNPDVPKGLEQITMHAMEANLNKRYASAEELLVDLEEFRKDPTAQFAFEPQTVSHLTDNGGTVISVGNIATGERPRIIREKKPETSLEEKEQSRRNGKRSRKTALLVGIASVILVLVLLFMFMWEYLLKGMLNPEVERIEVPTFVGQVLQKVQNDINYTEYFRFTVVYEESETEDEGKILKQDPEAGRQVQVQEDKIPVVLTVSSGHEEKRMPDFLNMDYRQAKATLEGYQLDLIIEVKSEVNDEVTSGYVIDQYPAVGTVLIRGGTVYLTYSLGPEEKNVEVPYVYGYTQEQAIARLQSYKLSYSITEVESDLPKGTVVFQSIEAGKEVPEHTEIALQISKGPAPSPSPEVIPSEAPSVEPSTPGGEPMIAPEEQ